MEVPGRKGATDMGDSISQSSTEDYDAPCQPCSFEGNNVAAEGYCQTCSEYLCKTCLNVHRKQSATRNHTILGKDQMPKVQPSNRDICTKSCPIHVQEIIKFYCKSHDVVGCGDCMVLDHKTCQVDLVTNVSSMTDDENRKVKKQIDDFVRDLKETDKLIKSSKRDVAENHSRIIKDIKDFREEINKCLDKMEADIVSEAKKANQEAENVILDLSKELQTLETSLKDLTADIDSYSGGRSDLFVSLKQATAKLTYLKMSHTHLSKRNNINLLEFERNNDLCKQMARDKFFGALKCTQPKSQTSYQISSPPQIQDDIIGADACFVRKIEVTDQSTLGIPKISGVTVFSDNEIIVTDNRLNKVRLIEVQRNEIKHTLSLQDGPFDITCIDKTTVAVTVPTIKRIKFISCRNGILKGKSDFSVNGECYGISRYSGGFVVSFMTPEKVELLDIDGNVLKSIVSDPGSGEKLFRKPRYVDICPPLKTIFVSDIGREALMAISLEGNILGQYKEYKYTRGVFASEDGKVLVADYTGNIILMTRARTTYKVARGGKDDLMWPLALSYCYKQKKLFVSNSNGNNIYIYQFP